eukprot:GHVO01050710.1.p2 GENE.GHVO01050710.1~~GHVO01050710.1.p2  ORF type:complete len:120 (+),score=14.85 GHVO01050710.1:43-402(+)
MHREFSQPDHLELLAEPPRTAKERKDLDQKIKVLTRALKLIKKELRGSGSNDHFRKEPHTSRGSVPCVRAKNNSPTSRCSLRNAEVKEDRKHLKVKEDADSKKTRKHLRGKEDAVRTIW